MQMDARVAAVFALIVAASFSDAQQDPNHDHNDHWVSVTVYYESLCPDSIKFFTQQLYPSLQGNLSEYVNLTLVPFGRSSWTQDINQYEFKCHHGPAECDGNRLHLCALNLIDHGTRTTGLGYNKVATAFINCLMDKVKPAGTDTKFPTNQCASINYVRNLTDIQNCANDVQGSGYLQKAGEVTKALNPPLKSVPTIVFNDKYKEDDNTLAQDNFVKALCQYIKGEKPAECSRNSAFTSRANFAIVAAIAAVFFAMN